jgi:hypothetical protein
MKHLLPPTHEGLSLIAQVSGGAADAFGKTIRSHLLDGTRDPSRNCADLHVERGHQATYHKEEKDSFGVLISASLTVDFCGDGTKFLFWSK